MFSRDTFLPLVLVVPLGYHGTTPKLPPKTSLITGTRSLDLLGSGVSSFIQRHTTDADHHPRQMTFDLSGFTNDQIKSLFVTLQQHVESKTLKFDEQVAIIQKQRMNDRMKEIERNVSLIETVNAAFEVCLNEILGDLNESRWIVSKLDKCRRVNDYRKFSSVHFKYRGKDLKIEEMIKTLAAIYRLKTKNYTNPSAKSTDRSIVRHEIRCPHCGEYAAKLVDFLNIKGIKWADV